MNNYVQQMVDWIEENLTGEFSLDKLANDLGYSPYYCSFRFHQATGISMRRYVLLRRLYLSTADLRNNRKVIDIAFDYGYSSQEAYSRAFKTVFGITPREFQIKRLPVQSFERLSIYQSGDGDKMVLNRERELKKLKNLNRELFDRNVLNILNGQMMYEEFKEKKLMGDSDCVPFNEAMCVHVTTRQIFDEEFIRMRAACHQSSVEEYQKTVIHSVKPLLENEYKYIVLWFGEDVFCQMNLLTLLAYLEQKGYKGRVFFNQFRDDEFKVNQMELELGNYTMIYEDVLVHHKKTSVEVLPVLYQAIHWFLEMQMENNEVIKYIRNNQHVPTPELVKQLFTLFPTLGYGDTQYMEHINKVKLK
ncbi:AraC family transcriptional regulator [Solibacillus sp. R5-41]|uniref:helix-turn-helix transcriptional regulator n=1 Tax=Solibacillus sp. R5-41 TaxID=2048654 RepID=UPI000C1259D8|nr:AraC family transcriptional regulator [Solibacillus sp. R5-41]ATP42262.1 AraC family transcriptional regulator [Solibacillus sp. R5-41]